MVRGIFDGRQSLGRNYSVLYYYARYVAGHPKWILYYDIHGILHTVEKIYETFLNIGVYQQSGFINMSYKFHTKTGYKFHTDNNNNRTFPNEPPPVRTPKEIYTTEMKRLCAKDKNIKFRNWLWLDEKTKFFYHKKAYRETQIYIYNYEKFYSSLSPDDLVAYTIHRARKWECFKISSSSTRRKFNFAFIKPKVPDDIFSDSDIDILNPTSRPKSDKTNKETSNHLLDNCALLEDVEGGVKESEIRMEEVDESSSSSFSSSSSSDDSDENEDNNIERMRKRLLRRKRRYLYDIDKIPPPGSFKKYPEGYSLNRLKEDYLKKTSFYSRKSIKKKAAIDLNKSAQQNTSSI